MPRADAWRNDLRSGRASSGMWRQISSREKVESVKTTAADRAERRVSQRRRIRSRGRNHSGCARKDTSWMVSARGTRKPSGAVYAGAKKTSRRLAAGSRAQRRSAPTRCQPCAAGSARTSRRVPAGRGERRRGRARTGRTSGASASGRRRPAQQQLREVAADAGRIAEDLARVHADPQRRSRHAARRPPGEGLRDTRRAASPRSPSRRTARACARPASARRAVRPDLPSSRSIAAANPPGIRGIDDDARRPHHLGQGAAGRGHDRHAHLHRFEGGHAESFVERRQHQHRRGRVQRLALRVADVAAVVDAAGKRRACVPCRRGSPRTVRPRRPASTSCGASGCRRRAARRRQDSAGRFFRGSIVPTNRIGPGRSGRCRREAGGAPGRHTTMPLGAERRAASATSRAVCSEITTTRSARRAWLAASAG